ncbi:leucine rich adaptor protein 1 [Cyclopterus lumpus]|uniref:leucine rich adaptor protein 1 n=1 Tax=Cyclopterus lumpus TaxID=8103 RepID=UPI0014862763|nr:leucine rich adaptor protein 1 [Cyclopterus lumpus]
MDEGTANETIPDLKDIEVKIGLKTPEGLLRWMREEASSLRGDAKQSAAHDTSKETGKKSLDEKIRKLKMEMVHLRSVDVKILQQLLAVHEGIEAVKWLLEERSTLTSRCSSLTSSQYSLGEGPETSWRGSWSSLQDPNDKLDNISIGSYLDTLADDMDEYCPSSSESVICSATPLGKGETGVTAVTSYAGTGTGKPAVHQAKSEGPKQDSQNWVKASDTVKGRPVIQDKTLAIVVKANGVLEKSITQTGSPTRLSINEKLATDQSPKLKPYKNGKIDLDTCKMNGKMHIEYDAHWRWVQSQEDVTFL